MSEIELKPCPFCASVSLTLTVERNGWKIVQCDDCERHLDICSSQAEEIKALRERVEGLKIEKAVGFAFWRSIARNFAERGKRQRSALTAATARADRMEGALTPSAETKGAYSGEFHFYLTEVDEEGDQVERRIAVPWTTIKEIMAAIRAQAADTGADGGK